MSTRALPRPSRRLVLVVLEPPTFDSNSGTWDENVTFDASMNGPINQDPEAEE